ncbi:carboxymuconolactone decarboxylase family protein [Streptomyces sp. C1-2]|uniref:carboxymuconolactone decarboxylase family protein n=1 Tax=Streptomyces sp. C1-2 TaxID=2720022 RepID=UPI001432694A|nr:carboxymuconolactone decarboxylase family protein [Streptomyces sp. C1-2]NJP74942.1 carboxymuconolactone decarboxylase family protein [Streptomyces sp. C1-2]
MNIDIPQDSEPLTYVWGHMVPRIGRAAGAFARAVAEQNTLGLYEFEAARIRIAQINGCLICLHLRTARDGEKVDANFADEVERWESTDVLDERSKLAAEYAERFALDHHNLGDEFWDRMTTHYSQVEIVELTMCIGQWLAFGRLNHVLGVDRACMLPLQPETSAN